MHQPKPNNINFALISSNFQCVSFVVHLLFLALIGFARQLFILTTLCSSKFHMAALRTLCVAVSSFPHRRLWSRGRDAMRCWRWSARNVLKRVQILLNIWLHMHGAHQINPPSLFRGRVAAWPRSVGGFFSSSLVFLFICTSVPPPPQLLFPYTQSRE